jgi:type IV fimbrial biogenesis protein FimT
MSRHRFAARKKRRAESGFSLIELMVTAAILTIITVIAIPTFSNWLPNHRLSSAARDLVSNLRKAKMDAIKSNTFSCVRFRQQIGATTWDYIVFRDVNQNMTYDAGDVLLTRPKLFSVDYMSGVGFDASQGTNGITYNGGNSTNALVRFDSRGFPLNDNPPPSITRATLTVFLTNVNNRTKRIVLGASGSIRITP